MTYNVNAKYTSQEVAMKTKLTLRMDETLIEQAKTYSAETGKSLSQIVANYFALLTDKQRPPEKTATIEISPWALSFLGVFGNEPQISEDDYRRYLEEKYL
jgi:hypothetical protein